MTRNGCTFSHLNGLRFCLLSIVSWLQKSASSDLINFSANGFSTSITPWAASMVSTTNSIF